MSACQKPVSSTAADGADLIDCADRGHSIPTSQNSLFPSVFPNALGPSYCCQWSSQCASTSMWVSYQDIGSWYFTTLVQGTALLTPFLHTLSHWSRLGLLQTAVTGLQPHPRFRGEPGMLVPWGLPYRKINKQQSIDFLAAWCWWLHLYMSHAFGLNSKCK